MTLPRRLCAALALLCLLALFPTSAAAAVSPTVGKPVAAVLAPIGPGARIVSAAGQRQWLQCWGKASSAAKNTVVLIAGLGAPHQYFSPVFERLYPTGRICWYDRPSLGSSPSRLGWSYVSSVNHADELMAALWAVGERKPMIFVGHSYGGLVARTVAARYPTKTAGLVLLDASYADQWVWDSRWWHEGGTTVDMLTTEKYVSGQPQLGNKPLAVVSAGMWFSTNWANQQAYMATLSRNSLHVTANNAYHVVWQTHPGVVIRAIAQVRYAAAVGKKVPACSTVRSYWAQVDARCGR